MIPRLRSSTKKDKVILIFTEVTAVVKDHLRKGPQNNMIKTQNYVYDGKIEETKFQLFENV